MTSVGPTFDRPYHPGHYAALWPDKPAVLMAGTGEVVTYLELEHRSAQLARLLRARGLGVGDHIAVLMENHVRSLEVAFAAMRMGMYLTPINWHLTADEAGYILDNSDARCLVTTRSHAPIANALLPHMHKVEVRLMIGGSDGFENFEDAVAGCPDIALDDEVHGAAMFYSSGTTGRPKGIVRAVPNSPYGATRPWPVLADRYTLDESTVYLSPAPLYHAAPGGWTMMINQLGGTNVVMDSFDASQVLELIERHRVTHAQFVPTMFVRMLKLTAAQRAAHDLSSLRFAIHSAAPCPVEIKQKMIEWFGPRIYEYYGSSEGGGSAAITPEEWLEHPGSVGKPATVMHVVDENGDEVPSGELGVLYAEGASFAYYNDPESTANAFDDRGWVTVGDIGYVADSGYLYLSDRRDDMIISGGVNIYSREIEDVLLEHPAVLDAGVIGVANEEFGQEVKAVVQLVEGAQPTTTLADEIYAWCRERLARFKCPRSIEFLDELPRLPSGKLLKRRLRELYDPATDS
ncbi:MAG: AMP-binding protein [Ilumatobacteraceae bacterium]